MVVVEIICIIDRSGSMALLRQDAIGGFNTFLEEQKKLPDPACVTLVLFNHEYKLMFEKKPLVDVAPLDGVTYVPSGTTALLDAIGRTLDREGHEDKGIVLVLTDGLENSSSDYTRDRVKELIKKYEAKGWQIHYAAANQDAFVEAGRMGIHQATSFAATGQGAKSAYSSLSSAALDYRSTNQPDDNSN